MTDFQLVDESKGLVASISPYGEQYVAPISYSIPYYVPITIAAQSFEIVLGKSGKNFIITDMLIATSKTFGTATTAETVTLYEATTADTDTQLKIIAQIDMLKNDRLVATGLNLLTGVARSIAAIATDTNVDVTVAGYYVPV